ncbi:MAG: GlxA family transcriptional regulator [Hyphomicrobiaceae bacterium]|nr:GlxA family transcriptional regulator [Hyphomicrobiaceae bacterium]
MSPAEARHATSAVTLVSLAQYGGGGGAAAGGGSWPGARTQGPNPTPRHFGFLLLPGFPLMSYASAIEPLRGANALAGRDVYQWSAYSIDGAAVVSSAGLEVAAVGLPAEAAGLDALFVCAGGNPATFDHKPTFADLRALARQGVVIGGMSGGTYPLARAGLLGQARATIHWEHIPALAEEFPELKLERTLFVFDRDRITCAGGVAAFDMMVEIIARDHGPELATAVCEWYLHTRSRAGSDSQRISLRERTRVANDRVLKALALMESRIEAPASRDELAAGAGVTARHLERLFVAHLGHSLGEHYLGLRLDRARSLLRQTSLSVAEIAVACGFVSTSHFARAYRARFGHTARAERATSMA